MLVFVTAVILYVFGFVFLYGVIRIAVRHACEDLEIRRAQMLHDERAASTDDRTFVRANPFVTNG
ncbi:hypothetical protein ACFY2R_10550 [Micromonospora olivasterospora]|uniref:Uncharacterized protein n=1 Tax=Micromonospora olivasterospora TaxID=1880 RepID=A0A562IA64_MICOL|nr:hypothetical protein [Micromonospora olivasterospora]TWH67514.1 hypothetical protein JD77_02491 [Micromonospora olivasterospora]